PVEDALEVDRVERVAAVPGGEAQEEDVEQVEVARRDVEDEVVAVAQRLERAVEFRVATEPPAVAAEPGGLVGVAGAVPPLPRGQRSLPLVVRGLLRPEPVDEPAAGDGRRPEVDERERPGDALRAKGARVQPRPAGVAEAVARLVQLAARDETGPDPLA